MTFNERRMHANTKNIAYGYLVNQVFDHITSIPKILTLATSQVENWFQFLASHLQINLWFKTEIHAMSLQQPYTDGFNVLA